MNICVCVYLCVHVTALMLISIRGKTSQLLIIVVCKWLEIEKSSMGGNYMVINGFKYTSYGLLAALE